MNKYIVNIVDNLGDFDVKITFPEKDSEKEKFYIYPANIEMNQEENWDDVMSRVVQARPELETIVQLHGRLSNGSVPNILKEAWDLSGHDGAGSPERFSKLLGISLEKAKEIVTLAEIDCYSRSDLRKELAERLPEWEQKAELAYELEESLAPKPAMSM